MQKPGDSGPLTLKLINNTGLPYVVQMEPWGSEHEMNPRSVLSISPLIPEQGEIVVVIEDSRVTLHARPDSDFKVVASAAPEPS